MYRHAVSNIVLAQEFAIFQLLSKTNEALLIRLNALALLNQSFHVLDCCALDIDISVWYVLAVESLDEYCD